MKEELKSMIRDVTYYPFYTVTDMLKNLQQCITLAESTPNDAELGAKIRALFEEKK